MRAFFVFAVSFVLASTAAHVAVAGCTLAPSEALAVVLTGTGPTQLSWQAPLNSGGSTLILYDVLRSATPGDFSGASCLATGITATAYTDIGFSGTGYYLIRSRNACGGSLGTATGGTPRAGPVCAQSDGLVGAWSFDEGTGTTSADFSANENLASLQGAVWTNSGKHGGALSFNGTSAKAVVADSATLDLTAAMTLEAWVYPNVVPANWSTGVYKEIDRYYLDPGSSHNAPAVGGTFGSGNLNAFAGSPLPAATWTHLAATYDGATAKLYVNGAQAGSAVATGGITTSASPLTMGGNTPYGEYFNGRLDDVRVYRRALSVAELLTDMNTPVAGPPAATGVTVTPKRAVVTFTRQQQFQTGLSGAAWSVDGLVGGSPAVGTITPGGLYTPPATVSSHTVTASYGTASANATVYVSNYPGTYTHHNDNFRTGQNLGETVLTPALVGTQFGKLFSYALDGIAYASPLYVANLSIPAVGFRNVVYVATEHDSVYAFDADGLSASPLWHASFINPAAGVTTVPPNDTGECCDIKPEIGITGTPVIDPASGTLYVVAKTKEVVGGNTNYVQRLHALNIATGAEKFGGPVVIQASVPGHGAGSSGNMVPFDPLLQNQRPALTLTNGVVYVGFAAHGNPSVYHGWVLGYDATTLQQVMAFATTPNARAGGVWQAGGGLGVDASGYLYFATGNGTFDADTGGGDYGDSVLKVSTIATVLDYFTPHDQQMMDSQDVDLGSGGVVLLPDQGGAIPHLLVTAGKAGSIYLINRDGMGHFNPNNDSQIVQSLQNALPGGAVETGNRINPAYFNGRVYFSAVDDTVKAYQLSNGLLSTTPTSQTSEVYNYPGGPLSISANVADNGILWVVERHGVQPDGTGVAAPGVLRAYDPGNLNVEYYDSNLAGSSDTMDFAAKFTVPLVANGKVFVAGETQLTVYGLLP